MGFGLLLCAYFMLTFMPVGMGTYSFAVYIIAGILSLKATLNLKDYCPKFGFVSLVSLLYVLYGVYHTFVFLDNLFLWGVSPTGQMVDAFTQAGGYAIEFAFHVFMLLSIMDLTRELGMVKLQSRATTNLVLSLVWGVGQIALVCIPGAAAFESNVFPKMLLLWALVCYLLNTFLLHACYQNICPAGEEFGKERKPSRFGFINRLNQKFEERSAKALQEQIDYQAEKQRRKEEKKKHKKKK